MKKEFDRDGYFLMRDFMGGDEAAEISGQIDRFIAEVLPTRSETLAFYEVKDQPETIMRLQNMEGHDEFFRQLLNSDRFVSLASKLLGDDVVAKNVQWFNKPARVGSPTPPHQDGFYFMLRPNEAVTLWLALDLVDEGNGCVRYVSGSNREGMRPHQRSNVIGFSQGITDYGDSDRERETPILAAPGDLFAHHCMTIHRADANTSERPRAALGFVYNAARAVYDSQRQPRPIGGSCINSGRRRASCERWTSPSAGSERSSVGGMPGISTGVLSEWPLQRPPLGQRRSSDEISGRRD